MASWYLRMWLKPAPSFRWSIRRGEPDDAHQRFHYWAAQYSWRRADKPLRAVYALKILARPVTASCALILAWLRHGGTVARQEGVARWRQAIGLALAFLGHSIWPRYYYLFDLARDDQWRRIGAFVSRTESKYSMFLALIPPGLPHARVHIFSRKAAFARACHERGVHTVQPLLHLRAGAPQPPWDIRELPPRSLFVKPEDSNGGRGAAVWRFRDGLYHGRGQSPLTAAQLWHALAQESWRTPLLVQPLLVNHPALSDLALNALSTLRVMTCVNEEGRAEVTHAILRFPGGRGSIVDNFHAGGLGAPVDIVTGEVGAAIYMTPRGQHARFASHPFTGAKVKGRILPRWGEVLELAERAQDRFPERLIVGWDIAILEDGPIIVEGNSGADMDIVQRAYQEPLLETRLGKVLCHHMERTTRPWIESKTALSTS
ncbi:MAG TPA: sugar-transfer associated ATP-grasp domain-containing protein [Dongiaceae bacterium]|jgi:hypothetical protein|nr:sugar-transfer associated ATP-grasp domain-containing protein [Dongiaceae bacterium]